MDITYVFLAVVIIFYCLFSVKPQEYKFRVIAPEYVCVNDNSSQTIIRLIGEDVPNLKYNWSIGFDLEHVHSLRQRNVLMLWQNLRKLDHSFNSSNQGLIYINNSFLSPGIKYIFNISAQKNDSVVDNRQFSLELITNTKSVMSADVSGPDITYSDLLYTARADVMSCATNPEYLLSWQLLDQNKIVVHEVTTKSRMFQLLPGMLRAGNAYTIKYRITNKTSELLHVQVLERGLQLIFNTQSLKIGTNQAIYIIAFFKDPDCVPGHLTLDWKCEPENECAKFESVNTTELVLKKGISNIGSYKITLLATKGNASTSATTYLNISEDLLPIIDIENTITSCNPSDSFRVSAHVSRLVIGCKLQWISLNNVSGYSSINNFEHLPGSPGKQLEIVEKPETIEQLTEEDQFVDKQFDLIFPSNDGSWKGLEGGSKYMFRLTASCLCSDDNASSSNSQINVLTAFADVEVIINNPPVLKRLEVSPIEGEALKTWYTFNIAKPSGGLKPISYKFGYIIKNKRIYFTNHNDQPNIITLLPFIGTPIRTVVLACDCNSACNSALGPEIYVKLPNPYTETEAIGVISSFKKSMLEQDYFNAFTLAQTMLKTGSKMAQNTTFALFYNAVINRTLLELQNFVKITDNTWKEPSSALLRYIKILDDEFHLPESILNEILTLRDKNADLSSEKLVAPTSRKLLSLQQAKQKRIVNNLNLDEIKDYLEISEMAVKRLSDFKRVEHEKQKLRDTVETYLPRVCQFLYNNYKSEVRIELSSLIFAVEKINIVRKYDEFIYIPYETVLAATLLIGKEFADKYKNQIGLCIGKILFIDDYFNIPQYVYNIRMYTVLLNEYLNAETENMGIVIEMPVKSPISPNKHYQCVLWANNNWDFSKCKTTEETPQKIKCSCNNLGYISLVPVERIITTTQSSNLFITKSQQESVETSTLINAVTKNTYADQIGDYKTIDNGDTIVISAAVWSITFLSLGILTIFCAFLILLKRLSKNKAVQSFQSVEYAQYFDEFNLE